MKITKETSVNKICGYCGNKYGSSTKISNYNMGTCDICKQEELVTNAKNFGIINI